MKKVYYAHSMHLYNTAQEMRDIKLLDELGYKVINPNSRGFARDYNIWLKDNNIQDNNKMEWFKSIISKSNVLAYRCHIDLKIPSGVMFEVDYALEIGLPVFELPTLLESRRMSVKETREYLRYNGQR